MIKRYFTVKGSWPFPFDMLRYDECFPASESDSVKLGHMDKAEHMNTVEINLITNSLNSPTRKRWESFLWKVV